MSVQRKECDVVINKPGNVTDRIILLGRNESSVYILKGKDEYALLGGGMVHIVPEMLDQLKELKIEPEKIKRIIILHSHFDHCGVVPFFKKRWPWATITASAKAKELLSSPKVIKAIESMNQSLIEKQGRQKEAEELGLSFSGIAVEEVIKGGDTLSCGELTLEVIDVPGHSSCSVAIYVPEEKAMFASDAGGIPFGDEVFTAGNSNFDQYQENLNKMAAYDIEIYLPEHYGARIGEDARNFLKKSIIAAKETRKILEESLQRTKDWKKSVGEMTDKVMEKAPADFLSRDIISIVMGQMLKYLSKQMPNT
ncbi:Beta-lactamase domain-containing protein [Desulfonema magnum]|uniref:Beta-lactamase domain-containing protein n=1 Tax=Desulfonema magnum TaxID=45655 RepID=A0A975GPC3_9BACT|nr:Beta-lactamase domain-containing protein [Desulfonema magnum]